MNRLSVAYVNRYHLAKANIYIGMFDIAVSFVWP